MSLRISLWRKGRRSGPTGPLETYPDGGFVAVNPCDSEPGGQVQHVLQNLLIELQVGQLPLPLQRAEVDLVRGQVLGEPEEEETSWVKSEYVQPESSFN